MSDDTTAIERGRTHFHSEACQRLSRLKLSRAKLDAVMWIVMDGYEHGVKSAQDDIRERLGLP